jgi:cytochrome c oxidase subunit 1
MALFAGIYYWYPKVTGRKMNDFLGHLHFWPTMIFMNVVFMPMFWVGLNGVSRRLWTQTDYTLGLESQGMVVMSSWGAWMLGLSQIPFIINFFLSLKSGEEAGDNPWNATTVEWAAPSPPPHGNFVTEPVVYRGPYEYSVPGSESDFIPQTQEG